MNRQEFWKEKGYTEEQIECHLSWERRKSKESRDRKKRNNIKNKEIINKIKDEILGKTFSGVQVIKISETVDGRGFWWSNLRTFPDGSSGKFRYFMHFEDYDYDTFISEITY